MIHAYWFEGHASYGDRVEQIREAMLQRGDTLCSSLFVLSELLVGPIKLGEQQQADQIEQYFLSKSITMLPYTQQGIATFTTLRAHHGVKSLDALHLAIATASGVDLFLTHDRRLHKLKVPGLPFIASLDTDLF
jgi:predicted nucleic acid-binding protein